MYVLPTKRTAAARVFNGKGYALCYARMLFYYTCRP